MDYEQGIRIIELLGDICESLRKMDERLTTLENCTHKGYSGGRPSYFYTGSWRND